MHALGYVTDFPPRDEAAAARLSQSPVAIQARARQARPATQPRGP